MHRNLLGRKNNLGGILCAYSKVSPEHITMAKRNADSRVLSEGLRIFIMSLNLMDLALEQEKIKLNNKL